MNDAHRFVFSTNWRGGKRLCGECRRTYDGGDHIEVRPLKPYTHYVCSAGAGSMGHSERYSGSQEVPELRYEKNAFCVCGAPYVERDNETWRLSWEMSGPFESTWRPVEKVASRHETHSQREGLLELIDQGEQIRNVRLERLVIAGGAS